MKNSLSQRSEVALAMNPKKFLVWLAIVSIIMLFAAFTSAYLVRKGEGNWLDFKLPAIFWYSSVVLLFSSVFMHIAYLAAKKDNFFVLRIAISITFVLGIVFLIMQYLGWKELVAMNVYFVGNPSGSFVYVLSGLHGLHIVSGLVVLLFSLVAAFRLKIHAKAMASMENSATYWHFLDILWLYLFVFLVYNS